MKFNIKEYITLKYSSFFYILKRNFIRKLILNLDDNKEVNCDEFANNVVKSFVPYHNPLSIFTSKYKIIFGSKGAFNDDILNGLSHSKKFRIYQYSRRLNKALAHCFLPKKINHWNYKTNDLIIKKAQNDLKEFYIKVFTRIKKNIKFDAWLSGNFGQFDEQEMAKAIKVCGSKHISFHKECMLSDGWRDFFYNAFKYGREPYEGNGIIVYNKLTKKLISSTGLFDEKKIKILGMLRLDELHNWRRQNINKKLNTKKLGVFFTQPTAQFPSMIYKRGLDAFYDKKKNLEWTKLVLKTNKALYELAIENNDILLIVKPKLTDFDYATKLFNSFGKIPDNLIISIDYYNNASELIKDCDVICAFNSSSILETITAGKKIICPRFEEAKKKNFKSHLLDFGDIPIYAESPQELKEIIVDNLKNKNNFINDLNNYQKDILKFWTNNPDGHVGKKMPVLLEGLIKS